MTEQRPPSSIDIPGWLLGLLGAIVFIGLALLGFAIYSTLSGGGTPRVADVSPTPTTAALLFPTRTPVPTVVPPTNTPPPTETPLPTETASPTATNTARPYVPPPPTAIAPTATTAPPTQPSPTPVPQDVVGTLRITNADRNHLTFAFTATNQTGNDISYGVLGVRAQQAGQEDRIQPSWSDSVLKAKQTLVWDDWMKIGDGAWTLTLVMCMESKNTCVQQYGSQNGDLKQIGGTWRTLSGPVTVP